MAIESDYSLTKTFTTKIVKVFDKTDGWRFDLKLKTLKDFYQDDSWNSTYHLWCLDLKDLNKVVKIIELKNSFDFLYNVIFTLGFYKEYKVLADSFVEGLYSIIPGLEIDYKKKEILIPKSKLVMKNDNKFIIMTKEIWDYILYLLKLSCGEKVEAPIIFTDPEAEAFYLAQKEAEKEVARIKAQAQNKDGDALIKAALSIIYSFPSITFDWLFNQTLAQIHWLAKYAAGAVSYDVNAQALAAGNMKKGKKLDFFIK